MRTDAVRNREALLHAAGEHFAVDGYDASISDIATSAGVGKGTVFRHFPSKDHLIAAIVIERLDSIGELGEHLAREADPSTALAEFLAAALERQQRLDLSFLQHADPSVVNGPEVMVARKRMEAALGKLVRKAQRAGTIRKDITGTDVVLMMCAPMHITASLREEDPQLWRRYLAIILDGMRPAAASKLPVAAPRASS